MGTQMKMEVDIFQFTWPFQGQLPCLLIGESMLYLPSFCSINDKCVLGAEIFVVQRQAIGECLSMVKSTDSFKREWNICKFSKLGENWLSEEFTVGDHKCMNLKKQINGEGKKLSYRVWFPNTSEDWGYIAFMPLTQLRDPKNGYFVNDCIVVKVELKVEFKHSVTSLS
ncbi:hypothetical protein KY284_030799 [Solanum tuberosum]|nr:hypothetical protein KY284_030799 [Solanum tuberosum]